MSSYTLRYASRVHSTYADEQKTNLMRFSNVRVLDSDSCKFVINEWYEHASIAKADAVVRHANLLMELAQGLIAFDHLLQLFRTRHVFLYSNT